jgi:hypothetical protein
LVNHFTIPLKTTLLQLLQNDFVGPWYATRAIDILYAQQPLAFVRMRI